MKTIIWIDDMPARLKLLGETFFHVLWEHDVCSKMILVGNNYKAEQEDANRDIYIKDLDHNIKNLFYRFCYEKNGSNELDKYYEYKEHLVPATPENLPENSSCCKVIDTVDSFLKNTENGDTFVCMDIMLNKDYPENCETLTDEILKKLSAMPYIKKIFIYSFYDTSECPPSIKTFMDRHKELEFFYGRTLVRKNSDIQKEFLGHFGIEVVENDNFTKQ